MFMKMYDEKKKKDAETNKSNQIKSKGSPERLLNVVVKESERMGL